MNSTQIRQIFLDFFKERGHKIVPSAPIVVKNDPTLMFTNAGMNQFKDLFLGNQAITAHRIADTQKCLRVSGKHNDLEEVGVDTYHHTMFEMLGNWSIGDPEKPEAGYFKKEAIQWSFELLADILKIPEDRMYATVFEGDEMQQIPADGESRAYWKQYLPDDQILWGNKKDNFWEMGDTGPCGPCTEIHIDCRSDDERSLVNGASLVNNDHPQVIEIWNNVFIQFNRLRDSSLEKLPANHVDTGMGFERLVRVLQGKNSNYDTDIFTPTIDLVATITRKKYTAGDDKPDIAFRVLADHIRAICFTIADGQLPSNTGAGYVIRRILRRAVRYYYTYLEYNEPLLTQLVPLLATQYADIFPELALQQSFVAKVILEEEAAFLRTLESGIKRFDAYAVEADKVLAGDKVFELMDTFGFPVDLSRLMAQEKNLEIDEPGFERALQEQKSRSRASAQINNEDWVEIHAVDSSTFVGYDQLESKTKISKYRKFVQKDKEGYQIVLENTPFYAESGGQLGDTGLLTYGDESIPVLNTKKENDLIVHFTDRLPQDPSVELRATVNAERRKNITYHHTATHLLHAALRSVLGKHVAQKGSLVAPDYLRFDFSHFAKMTPEEISKVESIVNERIRANIPVVIKLMAKDEAMKIGAMALFGEKYSDEVRVVIIDPEYSMELCGGTHVGSTGDIGTFKISSETAIAAGVRRVEALSGSHALNWINGKLENQNELLNALGNPKDAVAKVEQLLQANKQLEKSLERFKVDAVNQLQTELADSMQYINGLQVVHKIVDVDDAKLFKTLGHNLMGLLTSGIVILGNTANGKAQLQVNITDDLNKSGRLNAAQLVKTAAPLINGGGGGSATQASAGGTEIAGLEPAIQSILINIS